MKRQAYNTIDRSGQRFNKWLIVSYSHTDTFRKRHYLCRCDCGFEKVAHVRNIVKGFSKSCGCLNAENHIVHGRSRTRVYKIWGGMKLRCSNPKSSAWKWYGARGIKVCDEWMNSFETFYKDMGDPPSIKHSIDRINNDGNYCKENCKWSTHVEQCNNRRKPLPEPPKP